MSTFQKIGSRFILALSLTVIALAQLWLTPQLTRAADWNVSAGDSIQAAIDTATPGDTIHVQAGTFNESLIITKSLTLLGGYDASFTTRIPRSTYIGTVPGRVINIHGAGIEVTIDGFEIANGTIAGSHGGGIYVVVKDEGVVTINDNFIHDNRAEDGGGIYADMDNHSDLSITNNDVMTNTTNDDCAGIYANVYLSGTLVITGNNINYNASGDDVAGFYADVKSSGQFQIEDNVVMSNTAATLVTNDYGGLYFRAEYQSHGTFNRNQVIGNIAGDDYGGARVDIDQNSSAAFYDNEFRGNTAGGTYGGLAVRLNNALQLVMEHNVIAANTAVIESGGLYIWGDGDSQYFLRRNRILNNSAGSKGGLWIEDNDNTLWGISENNLIAGNQGSGIYLQNADFRSRNDTIAGNSDYGIMMTGTVASTTYLSNTILWDHTWSFTRTQVVTYTNRFTMTADYSDVAGGWSGTGNINLNPLFVGSGDYHLQPTSPAIDKVNPATTPAIDLDGTPRPYPVGGQADMGCYEWGLKHIYLPLVLNGR